MTKGLLYRRDRLLVNLYHGRSRLHDRGAVGTRDPDGVPGLNPPTRIMSPFTTRPDTWVSRRRLGRRVGKTNLLRIYTSDSCLVFPYDRVDEGVERNRVWGKWKRRNGRVCGPRFGQSRVPGRRLPCSTHRVTGRGKGGGGLGTRSDNEGPQSYGRGKGSRRRTIL